MERNPRGEADPGLWATLSFESLPEGILHADWDIYDSEFKELHHHLLNNIRKI